MDLREASPAQRADSTPPAPSAPTSSPARRVPMALRAGLILGVVCGIVPSLRIDLALALQEEFSADLYELITRWNMLQVAAMVAMATLAAAGAAELVRRTSGRSRRGAQLLLVSLLALVALSFAFYVLYYRFDARDANEPVEELWTWLRRIRATIWLLIAGGALLVGWHERRVRHLAAPLVVASLLAIPYDFYGRLLYGVFDDHWATSLQRGALDALHVALLLLVLRRGAPLEEAGGGWQPVAAALDRVASAFYARLWISASSITLVMLSFGNRESSALAKLWLLGVPLGVAIANLAAVHGIFAAGRPASPQVPRRGLYLAGALLMTAVFLSAMQLLLAYSSWPDITRATPTLPLVLPLLVALAHVVLSHALERLSWLCPSLEVRDRAWSAKLIVALSQLVVVGVQYYMTSSPTRDVSEFALLLIISVAASVTTLVSQARLCRALASIIRERNDLPTAQLLAG